MTEIASTGSLATQSGPDPRRWITLGVLIVSVIIVVLDTSVLNVAIPTMLRELDTTVPSLEWVVSGYALTLASLLIIGGRLGDIYGHRRLFIIGLTLFGTGSALAMVAPNVGVLILGEAVIEGTGAALMVPSTLALLSGSFQGRERAAAFAAWGAAMGGAAAFGPVVGGYLTTNYSWRWAFGINVIIAPLAITGALLFIKRGTVTGNRTAIDFPGAVLVAAGTFLIVFGLSQGPTYGWLEPMRAFQLFGVDVWPASMPVSIVTTAFLVGAALLAVFVRVEMVKEREGRHPLFEFSQMRRPSFRYGTIVVMIAALGQLGMLFCLPLFLQTSSDLTAQQTGLWLLPLGIGIIIGAQLGGRLAHRVGVTNVIRAGFVAEVVGVAVLIPGLQPGASFWRILPWLMLYGAGSGVANSQLTNVVLWGIPKERSGAAGGANSTARQLGAALGAATLGTLLTVHTVNAAVGSVQGAGLPAAVTDTAVSGIQEMGANWQAPSSLTPDQASTLNHLFDSAVATGARWALGFAALMFAAGGLLSLLIPQIRLEDVVQDENAPPVTDVGTLALDPPLTVIGDGSFASPLPSLPGMDTWHAPTPSQLRRLTEELEESGLVLDGSEPWHDVALREIAYALRPRIHERYVPSFGAIVAPTTPAETWREETGLTIERGPITHSLDGSARRYADGIASWFMRHVDGQDEWVTFDRQAGSERDVVILATAFGAVVVQRHPSGIVRIVGHFGVFRWDGLDWRHEPLVSHWIDGLAVADDDRKSLHRLLEFAVHDLGARGIGATLVYRPDESLEQSHELRSATPPRLNISHPMSLAPLRHALAQTDGAAFFDSDGTLQQIAVRLVPSIEAEVGVDGFRGMRHTAARRYSYDDPGATIIVVSEDGPVTVFRNGEVAGTAESIAELPTTPS